MCPTAVLVAALALAQPLTPAGRAPATPRQVMDDITPASVGAIVEKLASFGTRHTLSDTASETRGIGAARRWIAAELERASRDAAAAGVTGDGAAGGPIRVLSESFIQEPARRIPEPVEIVNVLGIIPGSMPQAAARRYYVIAHYDSRASEALDAASDAPGANDNASGTAVVLELARVLAARRLDATVVLMATAGEEQGLFGARHHARLCAEQGIDVRAVLNNDIVGDPSAPPPAGSTAPAADPARPFDPTLPGGAAPTPHLIRVFSEGLPQSPTAEQLSRLRALSAESDSPSRQLARFVSYVARRERTSVQPMLVFRPDRFLRGGDHSAFNEFGFPAVRFCEVHEDYDRQHQDVRVENARRFGDTPEFVDHAYLADVARLNAAVLVHLANAPSTPADVRLVTAELANDTLVRWSPSPEPDVAGYEVVWRATTSPDWTDAMDVGDVAEARIDLSKDNLFFGVRAYDREGYRSPVAFAAAAPQ